MSRGLGATIERRIHTRWCDDESARCNGSNQHDPPGAFSAPMPPSTIISMFNATSSPVPRCETSRRSQSTVAGCSRSRMKPDSPRLSSVTVTKPTECIPPTSNAHLVPPLTAAKSEGPSAGVESVQRGCSCASPCRCLGSLTPGRDTRPDAGYLREEPGAGKLHARICEGKSRMAELLDRDRGRAGESTNQDSARPPSGDRVIQ
jgi:hypothetical protein